MAVILQVDFDEQRAGAGVDALAGTGDCAGVDLAGQFAEGDLRDMAVGKPDEVRLRHAGEDADLVGLADGEHLRDAGLAAGTDERAVVDGTGENDSGEGRGDAGERGLFGEASDVGLAGGDVGLGCSYGCRVRTRLRVPRVGILLGDDTRMHEAQPALVGNGGKHGIGLRLGKLGLELGHGRLGLHQGLRGLRIVDHGEQLALADLVADVDVASLHIAGGTGKDGRLVKGLYARGDLEVPTAFACLQPGGEDDRGAHGGLRFHSQLVPVP